MNSDKEYEHTYCAQEFFPSWFDIDEFTDCKDEVINKVADNIKKTIDNEIKLLKDPSKLVIGGFNQGAVLAMKVGL